MKHKKAIGNLTPEAIQYNNAIDALTKLKRSQPNLKLADKLELYRQYEQNIKIAYEQLNKSLDKEIGLRN